MQKKSEYFCWHFGSSPPSQLAGMAFSSLLGAGKRIDLEIGKAQWRTISGYA